MNLLLSRILRMYVRQINLELEKIQDCMPRETIYVENGKEKCTLFRDMVYILCDIIRLSDELRDGKCQEPERDDSDTRYTMPEVEWSKIPANGEYNR